MTAGTKDCYRSCLYTGSFWFMVVQLQTSQRFVMFKPHKISEKVYIKCFSGWCNTYLL